MKNQIHDFISKITFSDPQKIEDGNLLFDEGIFDSMGLLNLISFLEDNYNIKVYDSELNAANLESINAIASYLERKLKQGDHVRNSRIY